MTMNVPVVNKCSKWDDSKDTEEYFCLYLIAKNYLHIAILDNLKNRSLKTSNSKSLSLEKHRS